MFLLKTWYENQDAKRRAQNRRILKERPWLWALLQEWYFKGGDEGFRMEVQKIAHTSDLNMQMLRSFIEKSGNGSSVKVAAHYFFKDEDEASCGVILSKGSVSEWREEAWNHRVGMDEMAIYDSSQNRIVVFHFKYDHLPDMALRERLIS
jgi:hypothetical protein